MTTIVREPVVTIQLQSSSQSVGNKPQRVLLVGQKTTGSAAAGALTTDIQNDKTEWASMFGARSMLYQMISNVRRYNKVTRVDAIVLADNGSTKAAGTITVVGTATEDGTLTVYVGSKNDYAFEVVVNETDNSTTIAAAIVTAINANDNVPVVASNLAGVVTLTAENAGTVGNQIGIELEGSVAGVSSFTITAAMTGGATDPSFTGIFDLIEDQRYQTVIWPYTDSITPIKSELDTRFNATNNILDGVAIIGYTDTYANLITATAALNSNSLNLLLDEAISRDTLKGPSIMEIPYCRAAQMGAVRALRLTEDAAIGRFVITRSGSLDLFGGMALASLPYFNTPMPDLPVQAIGDGFTATEQANLLASGGSIIGTNIPGNAVLLGTQVTTYKTDVAGNDDVTWKYLNYVDTSSVAREYFFNNLKARFSQSRLTQGAVIPGRSMANAATIEAYCGKLYGELANQAILQAGNDAQKYFTDNLTVTLDLSTGLVTVTGKLPIVTQLRTINVTFQVSFTVEE